MVKMILIQSHENVLKINNVTHTFFKYLQLYFMNDVYSILIIQFEGDV